MPVIYEQRTYSVTVGKMSEVIRLYQSLGFEDVAPIRVFERRGVNQSGKETTSRQTVCAVVCYCAIMKARYTASSLMPPNSPELRLYIQSRPRK